MLTTVLVALFVLPSCSGGDDGQATPGAGGTAGAPAASAGSSGASWNGGTSSTGGGTAGTSSGMAGETGTAGSGTAGSGGASLGGQGGAPHGGMAGAGVGGASGASGSNSAGTGPSGGAPHVTPQNATSVPTSLGTPIANPGQWISKTYEAYYYNANGSAADMFKAPVKQTAPMTKPVNIYTPPGYDSNTQYPYIVVLHGYGNNEDRWSELAEPKLVPFFDNLITSKATKPFIAVFPNGTVGGASNANGYYNFGGELMLDLIPFLEANYSLKKERGSRALAGFSFGGMQTIAIGLCAHLKDFAWFAGLDPAGPGTPSADAIAQRVATQNPEMYPVHYFYISVGNSDGTAGGSAAAAANGLATKSPSFTSANFSFQNNIPGGHTYPVAEVGLYNFLRMAFAPN
jgi:enterochelin esterase-like enzyme